jgi:organic hydroperoxide reductase OsmC/OhrA
MNGGMTGRDHHYRVALEWTGNLGAGTSSYTDFGRGHELRIAGKPTITGSSDPQFRGDATRWNPEELLLASLAACHQLWYLHLCADADVNVLAYSDEAVGRMIENEDGSGAFAAVVLNPLVMISAASDGALARRLHDDAARYCFIARSVNFPVSHQPRIMVGHESGRPA